MPICYFCVNILGVREWRPSRRYDMYVRGFSTGTVGRLALRVQPNILYERAQ